ncbi:MAG: Rrf2 family nitric oxide-sensitive transcriptional repressor [Planctomycetota bacterium]
MRITKHIDYALRVLIFLGVRPHERVSTPLIASAFGISSNHLLKVVRALGQLGLVNLHRGAAGGVELALEPEEINIGAVIRAMDDSEGLIECFQEETNTCVIAPACELKGALRDAQEAFYSVLDPITLKDIIRGKRAKRLRALSGD